MTGPRCFTVVASARAVLRVKNDGASRDVQFKHAFARPRRFLGSQDCASFGSAVRANLVTGATIAHGHGTTLHGELVHP